jgi:histidyl-tRNA synthetase
MVTKYQSFPGMEDILPGEVENWQWLEQKARIFFEAGGFQEIRTPILEPTELFTRAIGETTDIVHKEMYTFEDRGGRSMTMRPEMTAAVARAVIQNTLLRNSKSLAFYYMGTMFRAERPQAGRKRQFHQIGAEIINEAGAEADLKIILALYSFLQSLQIKNFKLRLNDLTTLSGSQGESVRAQLRSFFEKHRQQLDKDSVYRLDKNVLRIFDSKIPETQAIVADVPWDKMAPLSDSFRQLTVLLKQHGIAYEIDRKLVRGLDYYTGIVFEVALPTLGAQDAVAGGGRYDELYAELGGGNVPCTGFSLGMERLLMALKKNEPSLEEQRRRHLIYFAPLSADGEASRQIQDHVVSAAAKLRYFGFQVRVGSLSAKITDHLSKANKIGAGYVIIKGSDELKNGEWTYKDMERREQKKIKEGELINYLMKTIREGETV